MVVYAVNSVKSLPPRASDGRLRMRTLRRTLIRLKSTLVRVWVCVFKQHYLPAELHAENASGIWVKQTHSHIWLAGIVGIITWPFVTYT